LEHHEVLLMNCLTGAFSNVIPLPSFSSQIDMTIETEILSEIAVSVGVTGDISAQIVVEGPEAVFSQIGQAMFGMPLEGEMLYGFVSEVIGNMVAGNAATNASQQGIIVNITPPNVAVGQIRFVNIKNGYRVKVMLEGAGELNALILLQQSKGVA
jgi:chemotaxis protein CheX